MFNILFMLRRYLYILCLVFLPSSPYMQTLAPQILSMMLLVYLIECQPYETSTDNRVEVFNEACIYLLFATLHALHHSKNMLTQFNHGIGVWMMVIVCLNMTINGLVWAQGFYCDVIQKKVIPMLRKLV